VFGLSQNAQGEDNRIMVEANKVISALGEVVSVPIHMQGESFTSAHARMLPNFHGSAKRNPARKRGKRVFAGKIDDSAAALILQRYLDKNSNLPTTQE
jgi:RNase H-fold protein (predicted Holliday junction resolvase)